MSDPLDDLASALAAIVGDRHVLTDPDQRAGYETDWTGRFHGAARLVVRPASTDEVAAVVAICAQHGAAIVPQGGNTGLVGASVPRNGEVVLSTTRLTRCDPVDTTSGQVTVGAGLTLAVVRDHARSAGFDLAVDFAARDSATIGGAVATNAGGSRVVRFSTMRAQVAGVQAVMANGTIVGSLSGLPKETIGLHLPSLLSGSEGTLAIITAVRLRLVPWYRSTATALVALDSLAEAVRVLPQFRQSLPHLDSVELVMPSAMRLVCAHLGQACPVDATAGAYLLVECAAHGDPLDDLVQALLQHTPHSSSAVATDHVMRSHLLALRDNITVAINHIGVPLKLDVAVPLDALAATATDIESIVARLAPLASLVIFGHLAEGNLHVNILDAGPAASALTDAVLQLVIDRGGAISAEHGIGVAKTQWLVAQRGSAEISLMRSVKHALDPDTLFNPGVLLA
ncbi:unannotated protein [freshwater metagenome]|uniref:Unannotated protein n=1 Tax=freshwater metagenome TaxID=449393 RepID=A0A6J7DLG3_9ZZZZ|nr:FAD-binding protein [Actinomycetota bacterium]